MKKFPIKDCPQNNPKAPFGDFFQLKTLWNSRLLLILWALFSLNTLSAKHKILTFLTRPSIVFLRITFLSSFYYHVIQTILLSLGKYVNQNKTLKEIYFQWNQEQLSRLPVEPSLYLSVHHNRMKAGELYHRFSWCLYGTHHKSWTEYPQAMVWALVIS